MFKTLVLDAAYQDGYGNVVQVDRVRLAGPYAAFGSETHFDGGRQEGGSTGQTTVGVRDLITGGTQHMNVDEPCVIQTLLLTSDGTAASITVCGDSGESPEPTFTALVQALDYGTARSITLATSTTTTTAAWSSPYASLELQRCLAGCTPAGKTIAWWTDNGNWHSQPIP
ncbi:MAG TPA: hypothetical protein VMD48_08970 [Solirubrobacteraceae bacterium]|nr:hypothetical protein [Solirubrobacteraceae bacterium]